MLRLSTGLRNKMLGTDSFSGIFDAGVIYIYTGAQPASANDAVQGALLGRVTVGGGSFNFGNVANGLQFDTPSNGQIEKLASDTWQFQGLADGTAGWARLMGNALDDLGASTPLPRVDYSIGRSGADLNLSNTSIVTNATHTIDVFRYSIPAQ